MICHCDKKKKTQAMTLYPMDNNSNAAKWNSAIRYLCHSDLISG